MVHRHCHGDVPMWVTVWRGEEKTDSVTCKDQLPSDGQVPHHLTLTYH